MRNDRAADATGHQRRVRAHIRGRVQGVFFRATLRDVAEDLGLAGWVRNTPDGLVEAELQGAPPAVDKGLAFCREGPPGAHVEHVAVEDREAIPSARGFRIR
jgi:acylphosphatase